MTEQPPVDVDLLKQAISFHQFSLVPILHQIQEHYGYLPEAVLRALSQKSGIPLVKIYSVATFYSSFSLKPKGRCRITVCSGTTCHVRGSARVIEEVSGLLGIGPDEVTPDGEFSIETVNCLGCCAFAPVMVIDGRYHGHLNPAKTRQVITTLQEKAAQVAVEV